LALVRTGRAAGVRFDFEAAFGRPDSVLHGFCSGRTRFYTVGKKRGSDLGEEAQDRHRRIEGRGALGQKMRWAAAAG